MKYAMFVLFIAQYISNFSLNKKLKLFHHCVGSALTA